MRLIRNFIAFIAPRQPLRREIFYLERAIRKYQKPIDRIIDGGPYLCCEDCANPQLYEMDKAQERRAERLQQLLTKLARDGE